MASLLDFLRRKPNTTGTPQTTSGRGHYHGTIVWDEQNQELIGVPGARTFDRMWRTDADVRKALQMLINPIVSATFTAEPHGGDDADDKAREIARFVEWNLTEHMNPRLHAHVSELFRVGGRAGFAPFEQVWETTDFEGKPRLVVKGLYLRLPRTIWQWDDEGSDDLKRIVQQPDNSGPVTLDATDLVYYRFGAEGNNWEGESLLRAAYKHWRYKEKLELIQVIAHERYAIGVPIAYPPHKPSPEEEDKLVDLLAAWQSNEASYIVAPWPKQAAGVVPGEGGVIEILSPQGSDQQSGQNLESTLQYHSSKISASVMEEFMRLGHQSTGGSSGGSRALGNTQQNTYLHYCEALVTTVFEDAVNEQLIPRLVALNYGEQPGYPKLKASIIDSTSLVELSQFVQQLSASGALHPDQVLEDFLRDRADLPPADEDAVAAREKLEKAQAEQQLNPPPAPGDQGHQKTVETTGPDGKQTVKETVQQLSRQDRPLKPHEQHIQLDRIESAIDGARTRFEVAGTMPVRKLAHQLATEYAAGKRRTPGPPPGLVDALHSEITKLYDTGRDTVLHELASQGNPGTVTLATGPTPRGLRQRAQVAARAVTNAITTALAKLSLTGGMSQAGYQRAAEQAGAGGLRAEAQAHAAAALNQGREAQASAMSDLIAGARYTSILDGNRCEQCAQADDDVLRPLDDPTRLAHKPPNPDCYGGGRCRCLEVYQLKTEAPASLSDEEYIDYLLDAELVPNDPTKSNWVEKAGGLPRKIADLAGDLIAKGHDTSSAIAIAVEKAKEYAATAKNKAEWAAAVASWERKKASAHLNADRPHIILRPEITLQAPPAADVHVHPEVRVEAPRQKRRRIRVKRDEDGNATEYEER